MLEAIKKTRLTKGRLSCFSGFKIKRFRVRGIYNQDSVDVIFGWFCISIIYREWFDYSDTPEVEAVMSLRQPIVAWNLEGDPKQVERIIKILETFEGRND